MCARSGSATGTGETDDDDHNRAVGDDLTNRIVGDDLTTVSSTIVVVVIDAIVSSTCQSSHTAYGERP